MNRLKSNNYVKIVEGGKEKNRNLEAERVISVSSFN